MSSLVIRREGGIVRYFRWLVGLYGRDVDMLFDRWNLCMFCQTLFWMTVLTTALLPLIVFGVVSGVAANRLRRSHDRPDLYVRLRSSLVPTALGQCRYGVPGAVLLVVAGAVVWYLISIAYQIPGIVYHALLLAGWGAYSVLGVLAAGVHVLIGTLVAWVMKHLTVIGFTAFLLTVGAWVTHSSAEPVFMAIGDWRLERARRRDGRPFKPTRYDNRFALRLLRAVERAEAAFMAVARVINRAYQIVWKKVSTDADGRITTTLGPLGLVWEWVKALKGSLCPLVKFAPDDGRT